ncbi:tetratricopeptide repeat-containing sulfotransferase family protein [Phenylobacterium sp.]|uniref:tetratricopeptide repeat-containing sulfotransferase family protein n=1 Tax=Phenylobacterium sp. TaxID=1871053 RepID=UPI002D769D61|nr:sulfotransferase [Phenylobacterium sp.]
MAGETGTLAQALDLAARAVLHDPAVAAAQAQEILKAAPGHPQALFLLAAALRRLGDLAGARAILAPLAQAQARSPQVWYELGLTELGLNASAAGEAALLQAVALKPAWPEAWRQLAEALWLAGKAADADAAYARSIAASVDDPVLMEAAAALVAGRLAPAEQRLRGHLKTEPDDPAALRMLAEIGVRLGRYAEGQALLERALELAPSFTGARHNLAVVLFRQNRAAEALPYVEQLLAVDPADPGYQNLKAACLTLTGDYEAAIALYEALLGKHPGQPKAWLSYGHALKTAGRQGDSVAAYRRSLSLAPGLGEAYWSLANLKTFALNDDIEAMRAQLGREDLSDDDRLHLNYALGKAFEDAADYETSFRFYAEGARIRRRQVDYDAAETTANLKRARALFTPQLIAGREGQGHRDPAPIFVVGLPRSGSTLVEQILASHSQIEGTMELPDIIFLARSLTEAQPRGDRLAYPEVLATLSGDDLSALGRAYIARTAIQRKAGRPCFIDKMPNNFLHAGFISLILPDAKIIDTRRDGMATGFSAFKQHFARGQNWSYDLTETGFFYRDYVSLMAHFDAIMPGRIHRVNYEAMVEDTESEVRRLLAYCGLPFEAECLEFHRNARPVRTASSEQVRRPIFRQGIEQWRHFEPWLAPLKAALA